MFLRRFMDYHADRFSDCSLLISNSGSTIGLIPANRTGETIWSHQGLSYGGLLSRSSARHSDVVGCLKSAATAWLKAGAAMLRYKTVPHVFHRFPAEEDIFTLFAAAGRVVRRDLFTIVPLQNRLSYSKGRKHALSLSRRADVEVCESRNFNGFYDILEHRLDEKYNARPTHSADEMVLLANRFPNNIKLIIAQKSGTVLAGAVLFTEGSVIHTQYLGSSDAGRTVGALDAVIDHVINTAGTQHRYLSFGHSNQADGGVNAGLLFQKEGFGGRAIVHDQYEVDLRDLADLTL